MHKKMLASLMLVLSTSLLIACSTESQNNAHYYHPSSADNNLIASPTAVVYTPASVIIYKADETPDGSVEEITTIQINLYNEYGIMRQQAQINQLLKEQACSLGGNAVILASNQDKNHCTAKVVQVTPTTTVATAAESSSSTAATKPVSATKSKSQS